eukprot:m.219118 g.219118  ORF g.219118 m.219118 type:complete len:146 (+) comp15912_c1_seq1:1638-2075(+)
MANPIEKASQSDDSGQDSVYHSNTIPYSLDFSAKMLSILARVILEIGSVDYHTMYHSTLPLVLYSRCSERVSSELLKTLCLRVQVATTPTPQISPNFFEIGKTEVIVFAQVIFYTAVLIIRMSVTVHSNSKRHSGTSAATSIILQ